MKINPRRMKRSVKFDYKEQAVKLSILISDTGTLFFNGTIGQDAVKGFVHKHGGGYVIESDALGRRDQQPFYQQLIKSTKFVVKGK
jgi:hypothetical protein